MKETKIAKEQIEKWEKARVGSEKLIQYYIMVEGKATCQRWLEFLKSLPDIGALSPVGQLLIDLEMDDLKQAIKLYEDTGI